MLLETVDIWWIIVYFIIVLAIGIISSRKQTKEGFLLADRQLNTFQLVATISAGLIGAGALVAYSAYVYRFGISAVWLWAGTAVGLLIFIKYGIKLKKRSEKEDFYTLSDYFRKDYGKRISLLFTTIIFIVFFLFLLAQFIAGANILSFITGWSYTLSLLLGGGVIIIYLIVGGFKSVIKTDVFQYIILVILLIVFAITISSGTGIKAEQLNPVSMDAMLIAAFILFGIFQVFISPDLWQRMYAAKDVKTIKRALKWSALVLLILGTAIAFIGMAARNVSEDLVPEQAVAYGLSTLLPKGFLGLGLVVLFASIMSTADTIIFVLAMNISRDYLSSVEKLTKEQLVKITRISILALGIIGIQLAFFLRGIVEVFVTLANIGLPFAPTVIASFHTKLKKKAIWFSVLGGIAVGFLLMIPMGVVPETLAISLPISAIFLWVGQKFLKEKSSK